MVEKVTDSTAQDSTTTTSEPAFVSEKVKTCPSCNTHNPGTATRCGGCGDALNNAPVDTVPATCPHCAGDRPFAPKAGDADEGYHGECPHCHQSAYSADAAKKALEKGEFPEWGQKSSKFYP